MGLRDKYAYAISTAKGKFNGSAQERDGKLHWEGSVNSEEEKNEIWQAIKTIPDWKNEIVANITVTGTEAVAGKRTKTYTVKSGDTPSGIAKAHLGDASAYMRIYEVNRDQLSDPDKIKPGQVLKLP